MSPNSDADSSKAATVFSHHRFSPNRSSAVEQQEHLQQVLCSLINRKSKKAWQLGMCHTLKEDSRWTVKLMNFTVNCWSTHTSISRLSTIHGCKGHCLLSKYSPKKANGLDTVSVPFKPAIFCLRITTNYLLKVTLGYQYKHISLFFSLPQSQKSNKRREKVPLAQLVSTSYGLCWFKSKILRNASTLFLIHVFDSSF